jgi:hypothetical protein
MVGKIFLRRGARRKPLTILALSSELASLSHVTINANRPLNLHPLHRHGQAGRARSRL